ncbi:MAG: ankyrin repeat domain-containing protein [Betaproteobacteria bacterium]|nr:ankyrin repeat domain-containing protein [Betaproteobacteria bacterium]
MTTRDSEGPLHISAYYGHLEIAKLLLDSGANVGKKTATSGFAPIHLSVYKRHLGVTELLVDRGASVCDRTDDGRTAITMARRTGVQEFIAWAARNGKACE